jgi:predicted dithiol-disulfide oxidoreductase (DUF899 family)
VPHLNQRDVTFVAISRAALPKLQAFATRLRWSFKWLSSSGSDFNCENFGAKIGESHDLGTRYADSGIDKHLAIGTS